MYNPVSTYRIQVHFLNVVDGQEAVLDNEICLSHFLGKLRVLLLKTAGQ